MRRVPEEDQRRAVLKGPYVRLTVTFDLSETARRRGTQCVTCVDSEVVCFLSE